MQLLAFSFNNQYFVSLVVLMKSAGLLCSIRPYINSAQDTEENWDYCFHNTQMDFYTELILFLSWESTCLWCKYE